jgi:hypothetical protein
MIYCFLIPCKHCETTDIDYLIQELDWTEDPDGCKLVLDLLYGKKKLAGKAALQLETADLKKLPTQLA